MEDVEQKDRTMETRRIKTSDIVPNEGQIAGLPTNPRQWSKTEMENLKKSLLETPELFEARGIIVYPLGGKFVVLGGNMRLSAAKALKMKDVPCIVMPEETPVEKLKEIVIKDNGAFGEWDYDLLANEWDDLPLTDWGVPAWNTEEEEEAKDIAAEGDGDGGMKEAEEKVFDSKILVCSVSLNGESEDIVLCGQIPAEKTEEALRIVKEAGKDTIMQAIFRSLGV